MQQKKTLVYFRENYNLTLLIKSTNVVLHILNLTNANFLEYTGPHLQKHKLSKEFRAKNTQ